MEIERRNLELELRVVEDESKKPKITGHAAVFDKLSEPMFGFREKIAPGTFTKTIKKDDVRALFNHDANYVLGRNKAKTLRLKEDDEGLYIEIDPPDTQWSRDLQESIRRGDISQMSFGFIVVTDEWEHKPNKDSIRTLTEVKLFDVSPVTYPAYPETTVKVRDYLNALKEQENKGSPIPTELPLAKLGLQYGYKINKKEVK
jgi:HK97 family phage prohead protease